MDKVEDYANLGRTYFNELEGSLNLHFGIADRFLLRSLVDIGPEADVIFRSGQVYEYLKDFGYESMELDRELELFRRYGRNTIEESIREYENFKLSKK